MAAIFVGCAVFNRGWLALALLSIGLFTALVALATGVSTDWVEWLDTTVANRFATPDSHRSIAVADAAFAFIGDPKGVAIVAAICGGLLSLQARSVVPVVLVVGAVAAGVAVEHLLKAIVGRTVEATVSGQHSSLLLDYPHSYPSGHVAGSAALLGTIAVILGVGHSRAVRAALAVLVVICVLSVALMALYVHAHLFSDVIGGMFLGGGVVSSAAAVLCALSARNPRSS